MKIAAKAQDPVERAKSPIWGCPSTSHATKEGPPTIVLQLEPAMAEYEPFPKDPSNTYLKVPQQHLDLYQSPLDSIMDQPITDAEQKPICTIRKVPKHSTYVYQPPLLPIKEYPYLEELAVRGWVDDTGGKTKKRIVEEWNYRAGVPTIVKDCNSRK